MIFIDIRLLDLHEVLLHEVGNMYISEKHDQALQLWIMYMLNMLVQIVHIEV